MKNILIILALLLPITVSAQLLNSYGVVEIGSSFPMSSTRGAKFAYRTTDSSFYRWIVGNTWVKVVEPSIEPDTLYLKQLSGTTALVDGDTIDISTYLLKADTTSFLAPYIRLAGYGLLKSTNTLRVDTSLIATRFYTNSTFLPILGGTLTGTTGNGFLGLLPQSSTPSTPASGFRFFANGAHNLALRDRNGWITTFDISATGNRDFAYPSIGGTFALGTGTATRIPIWTNANTLGDSPILYNSTTKRTTWDSPGVIDIPMGTDAERPSPAVTSDFWYNTTGNGIEWYNGSRWAKGLESTANRFATGSLIFVDANGQATQNNTKLFWDNTNNRLGIGTGSPTAPLSIFSTGAIGFRIFPSPTDINWWRLGLTSGGGFLEFNPSDVNISNRLSLPETGVARFRSGNQNPQSSHFFNTNYRMYFSGGVGNANGGGGDDGGDLYFMGGDSPNSDAGVTGGDIYIQGGQAYTRGAAFAGNVILNWSSWGNVGVGTRTPGQEMDINGDLYVRDSIRLGTVPLMSSATKIAVLDANNWIGYRNSNTIGGVSDSLYKAGFSLVYRNNAGTRRDTIQESFFNRYGSMIAIPFTSDVTNYNTNSSANVFVGTIFSSDTSATDLTLLDSDVSIGGGSYIENKAGNFGVTQVGHAASVNGISTRATVVGFTSSASNAINSTSIGVNNTMSAGGALAFGNFNTISGGGSGAFGSVHNITQANRYQYGNGSSENSIRHFFYGNLNVGSDSSFSYNNTTDVFRLSTYGTGTKEAADLSKTQSNYIAGFATDGTVTEMEGVQVSSNKNLLLGTTTDVPTSILTARSTTKSSSPFPFHTTAESNAITGVGGNFEWVTDGIGPGFRWHNGTRGAYGLESTFARGTATRVPFFDANGQITDNSGITFQNPGTIVGTAHSSLRVTTSATATANNQFITGTIFTTTNSPGAFTGVRNHVAAFLTDDATGSTIAIGRPYSNNFFATITSDFSTRNFIFDSGNSGGNLIFRKAGTQVLSVGSPRLAYAGSFFSSATESLYGLNTSFAQETASSAYFLMREGTAGYKAAFGHDGNGSATIYAQRANTNFVAADMKLRLSGATGYAEFLNNTAGVLLGGGTTAQTPTEANGLIRYNSDSTLYQIYQGGARAFIATRAYVRSSALNIGNSNLTLTGNRTLSSGGFSLTLSPKTTVSDTFLLPLGKVKTNTYAPIMGKNVNWAENGSIMYGENIRSDSTGFGAGQNVLFGLNLMQKARASGGRFMLFGDNILNGITSAFNVVGIGIQVADQSTTAGSDFFVGGSVVARYATSLDRAVILASRSFNRVAGVNLTQTVAFGYGAGSTSTERSAGGTHYGYLQLQSLVSGDQISTYGYLAGRVIKRGTNLSFIGNYTGATDTMFSDASAIGNYAAIGQNQAITIGAINGVNSATYDAKIGIGTTTPSEKLHVVGNIRFGSYGTGIKEATDLSLSTPTYIAAFAPSGTGQGTILDYRIARDTFIEDVTLFSVGTLLNTCQELTIVSSMTVLASSDQEIRFPDASDVFRGRKIIVYSKKKDAGLYLPKIKVAGGVSRLYFTTNPAVGGTDPSDQSTLTIDDSTWSDHGTTFEFTCLKIDNTPAYRWVLKQR